MPAYVNLDDPRAKKTRGYLQKAFVELLSEKEFPTITVGDIARRAELNRATFYGHYQDKFELLDATLEHMLEETIRRRIPAVPEGSADEAELVRQLIIAVCEWLADTKKINRKLSLSSSIEQYTRKKLYSIIYECLGLLGPDAEPRKLEIKAVIAGSAIYGAAMQWSGREAEESAETLADSALPYLLGVIRADGNAGSG